MATAILLLIDNIYYGSRIGFNTISLEDADTQVIVKEDDISRRDISDITFISYGSFWLVMKQIFIVAVALSLVASIYGLTNSEVLGENRSSSNLTQLQQDRTHGYFYTIRFGRSNR